MTEETAGSRATRPHRWSFPLVQVRHIQVRVHISFLILVALFALAAPEPGVRGALLSVAWLLAVFACVVLHELGHSFVAMSRGAEVDEILLFPLGGVSRLRHLPDAANDELAIAIAGPLTSFGIALVAAVLCVATGRALVPIDLVDGSWLSRLAWLNLLLGAFNLLPAFPLDGGRLLRALLERKVDVLTATRTATRIGHALAGALIVLGLLADVWLALIGLFVWFGASAEEAATIVHVRLRGHRVGEVMEPACEAPADAPAVGIEDPLDDDVLQAIASAPGHEAAVTDDGRVVGTVSLADVGAFLRATEAPVEDHHA
jgi:stage IV sporulation protein FB